MDLRSFNNAVSIAALDSEWYGWMIAFGEQKRIKEKAFVVYFHA
jgi:hypothetical protein